MDACVRTDSDAASAMHRSREGARPELIMALLLAVLLLPLAGPATHTASHSWHLHTCTHHAF